MGPMSLLRTHRNRSGLTALCAVLLAIPGARGAAQKPVKPFQDIGASALTLRDSVAAIARNQVGRRYVLGGASPKRGFDCSGLVKYVLQSLKIEVPRTARAQAKFGFAVARDTTVLRPGDLLLFGKAAGGVSHVGIYVGHGRYVHASSIAGRVIESHMNRLPSPLIKALKSVRRALVLVDKVPVQAVGSGEAGSPAASATTAIKQKQ